MEAARPEWSEEDLPLPEIQPEVAKEPVADKLQALSFAGGELATEAMKKLPEAKLVHVEQAASRGDAVERVYELRHEIRDEPGAGPAPVTDDPAVQKAASIGSIIAKLPARRPDTAKPSQKQVTNAPALRSATPVVPEKEAVNGNQVSNSLYSQAIKVGFLVAILLIFTFAIALILT